MNKYGTLFGRALCKDRFDISNIINKFNFTQKN